MTTSITKTEPKKPVKTKKNFFKRFLYIIFAESWGLKILALLFAAAIWALFKMS